MKDLEKWQPWINRLPAGWVRGLEAWARKNPKIRARMEEEDRKVSKMLEAALKPYHGRFERRFELPEKGVDREGLLSEISEMSRLESPRWDSGHVSGGIYHGDAKHLEFLNQVYALHSQSNPLHSDLFPSATKFEAEIVSMVSGILGRKEAAPEACGTVTSGGTESILLAMKTYRDRARRLRGIRKPEIIAGVSAHAAFDKASEYFGIRLVKVPLDSGMRTDPKEVRRALNKNTIAIIGSAPSFPHGVIDPIEELSEIALARGIGFHTDACLGGFILPFAKAAGFHVPSFDFRLRGVTSISVDTHKYGFAAKGTSVLLFRDQELRRDQYFTMTDWPGGLYFSPTLAGSRPGALSATCWASLVSMGREGYQESAARILETGARIRDGVSRIPGLQVIGDPLWIIAFRSTPGIDIFEVLEGMSSRGWSLNGLHRPDCLHLAVTLRHTLPGVADLFLRDLEDSVDDARRSPGKAGGMAPVYGMASSLPFRGMVSDLLKKTLDALYKV